MAQLGRSQPFRPHLAGPLVAGAAALPVVAAGTFANQTGPRRYYERRGAPHPHLPGPIVAPGGPVVEGITSVQVRATKDRNNLWRPPRPHLAKPLLFVPGVPLAPPTTITQAEQASRIPRRGVPRRLAIFNLLAQPSGGAPLPVNQRTGLFPRGQWKIVLPHLPPSPITFTTPVVAGQTVVLQDPAKRWYRNPPKPHLGGPIVAPGGGVIPAETVVYVPVTKRSLQLRRCPGPHVAPPTLTQPAAVGPFAPAVFKSQALRRPLVGRTTPRPHMAPRQLSPARFAPAVVVSQCQRRPYVGRTVPRPHQAGPVVIPFVQGPSPLAPAVVVGQALRRPLVGRRVVQAKMARPLVSAPPVGALLMFDTQAGPPRWVVSAPGSRWETQATAERWTSGGTTPRWGAGKSSQHPWQEDR